MSIDNALSMCDMLVSTVAKVSLMNLPKRQHEAIYQSLLPHRQFFFDWTKKKKNVSSSDRSYIANYYQCSLRTADEYIKILSEDQLETILKMYKYGKQKMVSL
jgi:hypothetical protein